MNCRRIDELLLDYLYGELPPDDTEAVRAHLADCPRCAEQTAELARVRHVLARLPEPGPSKMTVNRVLAQAREQAESRGARWGMRWWKVLAPICLMVVVGGLVLYQLRSGLVSYDMQVPVSEKTEVRKTVPPPSAEERPAAVPSTAEPEAPAVRGPVEDRNVMFESADRSTPPKAFDTAAPLAKASPEVLATLEDALPPAGDLESATVKIAPQAKRAKTASPPPQTASTPEPKEDGSVATETFQALAAPPAPRPVGDKKPEAGLPAGARRTPDEAAPDRAPAKMLGAGSAAPLPPTARPTVQKDVPRADRTAPDILNKQIETVEKALAEGRFDQALDLSLRVLRELPMDHPGRPRIMLGLAQAYEGRGESRQARLVYRTLAEGTSEYRELARRKLTELGDD